MKRHLLHIAIIGAALSAFSTNADAQLSPLLTPRLKLKDPASVNTVTIGPPALTAPYTLTLPPNDGDAQQVLTTDGNGVLTWTTPSSGSGTLNTLAKFTSATTIGNSNLTDDGTRVVIGGSLIDVGVWGTSPSTVTIGNSNVSSSVNIVGGVGGINIGAVAAAGANITVAGGGNLYTLNLGAGSTLGGITQTINIGNGSTTGVKNVTIGSNATTSNTTLISGSGGLNLNVSINQPTNINTGTSTGTVSIGNSLSTTAIAGATGITGATTINTTGNANTTIGSATTTGTTTIATNGTSGRFVVSGLPVLTSGTDDVLIVNASNQISRISQNNLIGSSWQLTGNATADAWNGTAGTRLGTTSAQPLVLATTNATAQDIIFYTGANGASERMRIAGTTGLVTMQNALTVSGLITGSAGATVSGAVTNINVNSNFATNINTGTSTGAVNIGGTGTQTIAIGTGAAAKTVSLGSSNTTSSTTLLSGSGGLNLNASNNQPTNINTGTSTGAVTIGNAANTSNVTIATNGTTGRLVMSGLPTVTTGDDVAVVNASNQVSRITQANLVSGGTIGGRVATATDAMSTLITDANVTGNDIIMVTLETTTIGAATNIPVYTIVRAAGSFTVHYTAPFNGFVNYTIINK